MLSILITLLIYAVVIAVVWWIWQQIPVPAPFRWIGAVVIGIIAIVALLSIFGGGGLSLGAPVHLGGLR
jgi:hypothetical protein